MRCVAQLLLSAAFRWLVVALAALVVGFYSLKGRVNYIAAFVNTLFIFVNTKKNQLLVRTLGVSAKLPRV